MKVDFNRLYVERRRNAVGFKPLLVKSAVFIEGNCLQARRLHDIGLPSWLVFSNAFLFVSVPQSVAIIIVLVVCGLFLLCGLKRGTSDVDGYGFKSV